MSESIKQKTLLINDLVNTISHNVQHIDNEILGLISSRDSDTKSSVGDKHETTRAKIAPSTVNWIVVIVPSISIG